jgi:peptide/nickel transport system permease protein
MKNLRALLKYPSAILGLVLLIFMLGIAAYAMITIPYAEAIRLWRGAEEISYKLPKMAAPTWWNTFRSEDDKLPETIYVSSLDESVEKVYSAPSGEISEVTFELPFDYAYDRFPDDIRIFFDATFNEKKPHVNISLVQPNGEEVRITSMSSENSSTYILSQDELLTRRYGRIFPGHIAVMAIDPTDENTKAQQGTYTFKIKANLFEAESDFDAELVVFGDVYGIAGTDHRRRDISTALLWGTPIALIFGLLAAVGTSLTTMIIAAIGTWYGGWVDAAIQRITEINLVIPYYPIVIMIGTFYSRSIWLMLGVTVLLFIFGGGIKSYRAIFLQLKESGYIEAAQAYGASGPRIILRYLVPRILPTLIPGLVTLIPTFVFIETALNVLGLGDPILPTWGKVISDANVNGALFQGMYWWILEPAILLMITALAFSLLGFALDRIFNPRLRGM